LATREKEKIVLMNATKRRLDNAELDDMRRRWLEADRAKRLKSGTPWMIRMLRMDG
jgi:hypothetical protein